MKTTEVDPMGVQDMSQLHAATCLLMTRFINGYQCPKLAHVIVQQLQKLLAHPETRDNDDSRQMYLQLLEHWQNVSSSLVKRNPSERQFRTIH